MAYAISSTTARPGLEAGLQDESFHIILILSSLFFRHASDSLCPLRSGGQFEHSAKWRVDSNEKGKLQAIYDNHMRVQATCSQFSAGNIAKKTMKLLRTKGSFTRFYHKRRSQDYFSQSTSSHETAAFLAVSMQEHWDTVHRHGDPVHRSCPSRL